MTVSSLIEAVKQGRSPLTDPLRTEKTQSFMAEAQPSDISSCNINNPSRQPTKVPLTPDSPLKSAMEVPGTLGQKINNRLNPNFREEHIIEKHEETVEKEQARDLVYNKIYYKIA